MAFNMTAADTASIRVRNMTKYLVFRILDRKIEIMELFGGDSKGLYMLNSELKARVYTAPSLVL